MNKNTPIPSMPLFVDYSISINSPERPFFDSFRGYRSLLSILGLFFWLFILLPAGLYARTWQVGPGKEYSKPSELVSLVDDGDIIYIYGGTYENDACVWRKSNLSFVGVITEGNRPVIKFDGYIPNRKGIWVFDSPGSSDNIYIANLIFDGAKVTDADGGNGAGIRFQAKNLRVENCLFRNCQNGILEGNQSVTGSKVTLLFCEFYNNGYSGYEHHIYINASTDTLEVGACYFHHPRGEANSLKTRAQNAFIIGNLIDEADGNGSYEINIAQGGNNIIMGNIIIQGPSGGNHGIVGYDDVINPVEDFYFINNTVINEYPGNVRYFNIAPKSGINRFKVYNNVFSSIPVANVSLFGSNIPAVLDTAANVFSKNFPDNWFVDAENRNFNLTGEATPLIDKGVDAGSDQFGFALVPMFSYDFSNFSVVQRVIEGTAIDIGAYEYAVANSIPKLIKEVNTYPNPNRGIFTLNLSDHNQENLIKIVDRSGRKVGFKIISSLGGVVQVELERPDAGVYYVLQEGNRPCIIGRFIVLP
ncbi:MAG: T9SS type A sorting domain-containing protein [Saprospiraceae bacterium]|nr:T9SS type A sorting domain-containing protein [Saprospiraceae bacterium]